MDNKPFSQACENNKQAILEKLKCHINKTDHVLEIGSGTGQHAYHFANHLPHITWQTSDLKDNHAAIHMWINESIHKNILPPLELDVCNKQQWPNTKYNLLFTANTIHIMAWSTVLQMITMTARLLQPDGSLVCYGPFNINGEYTRASNEAFDQHLKSIAKHMGIRDLDELEKACLKYSLKLSIAYDMPANNKLLIFKK